MSTKDYPGRENATDTNKSSVSTHTINWRDVRHTLAQINPDEAR